MSIEFVTAPSKGVTISLAGHTLFAGHRLAFTLDAIQLESRAHTAVEKELLREQYRGMLPKQRSAHRNFMDHIPAAWREMFAAHYTSTSRVDSSDLTAAIKKSLVEKIEFLASRLDTFVHNSTAVTEKTETPKPTS